VTDDNPLPTVIATYQRITGLDANTVGKKNTSGDLVVPCVSKANHKHADATPSLRINLAKDAWRCDPCAAHGTLGGRATHLMVAAGMAADTTEAAKLLAPRKEPERAQPPPPPDQQRLAAEYDYRSADGTLLYQVRRFEWTNDDGSTGKTFSQRRALPGGGWEGRLGDVERTPYKHCEMIEAIGSGKTLYVVEGEKDVDTLWSKGLAATTNAGGAGWTWTQAFLEFFRASTNIVVIGDNDDAGRASARSRAEALSTVCAMVRLVESIPGVGHKGDVTDWFAQQPTATAKSFRACIAPVARVVGPEVDDGTFVGMPLDLLHRRMLATQNVVVPSIPFSIPALDDALGGMQRGRVTVLASRTNQGKTALAMMIATKASRQFKVLAMSLEMGQAQWHDRIGANAEEMAVKDYRAAQRPDAAGEWWWRAHNMIVFGDSKDATMDGIEAAIALHQPDLVVIDHLRHIKGWMSATSKRADLVASEIMYRFPEMAKKRKTSFLLLHQLNRQGASEPALEDLRDAGAVEEVADNILLIHRPFKTVNGPRTPENVDDVMHTHLAKSREGGDFLTHLGWNGPPMDPFPPRNEEQRRHFTRCCTKP
jgi:KaiC/GvpD/RAD55 family RecA-like ATPase